MFFAGCTAVCIALSIVGCLYWGLHLLVTREIGSLISFILIGTALIISILFVKHLLKQKRILMLR